MIAGFILAGLVSFVAGFILHVGAFSLFALTTSMLYLAVTYENSAIFSSVSSAIALFLIMQVAYVIGVLVPFPFFGKVERRWFDFPGTRGRVDSHRKKSG